MQQLDELRALVELESPDIQVTMKPWWILLDFPEQERADDFQRRHDLILKQWGTRYRVLIGVQGRDAIAARPDQRSQPMTNQPLILDPDAGLQLGRMKLGRALLREMTYYLENPSVSGGFVDMQNEHQCMLSAACVNFMENDTGTLEDAVEWKREDYWLPAHLSEFRAESRLWTPNDGEWHEFRYLSFDPLLGSNSEQGWTQFLNRFKLVTDGSRAYHVCENLEAVPAARPDDVRAIA